MPESGSQPFILVPPEVEDLPPSRYPSLAIPFGPYLIFLLCLPFCIAGTGSVLGGYIETRREIARSAYTKATFVEAARRPGLCRYTLVFQTESGKEHRTRHFVNSGKRGCSWSEGERVHIRYVREDPDRIRLLEPSGDWTPGEAILFGLVIGSFTVFPIFIGSAIFLVVATHRLLLRYMGRPLIGHLIELKVSRHRSTVRIRGDGINASRTWISSSTLEVTYRVQDEQGHEVEGHHTLERGEGSFEPPRPGTKLLIMYAGPRLHRAL